MSTELIARASAIINAPNTKVWDALVDPEMIKQFMFGTETVSEWKTGSPIVWKGEWQGKPYEDKGMILKFEPGITLQYTHFSKLTELKDVPANYHTITYILSIEGDMTLVAVTQDNNKSEQEMDNSRKMWETMLTELKKLMENQ